MSIRHLSKLQVIGAVQDDASWYGENVSLSKRKQYDFEDEALSELVSELENLLR